MRWNYRLLSVREWSGRNTVALSASANGIYLSRANLVVAFYNNGRQINLLTARLRGGRNCLIAVAGRQSQKEMLPVPPVYADGQTGSVRKG